MSIIDQINVTYGTVQHTNTDSWSKLLDTVSYKWSVIPLVVFQSISGYVVGLHYSVLSVKVAELVKGWMFSKEIS